MSHFDDSNIHIFDTALEMFDQLDMPFNRT